MKSLINSKKGAFQLGIGALIVIIFLLWAGGIFRTGSIQKSETPSTTSGVLLNCEYKAGHSADGNVTIREDTSRNDLIHLDIDESLGCTDEAPGKYTQINITCTRSGNIGTGDEIAVMLVGKSEDYLSEVNTNTANEYNILEKKSTASNVWSGEYQSEIYFSSTASTSASDIEKDYLTFGKAEKEATESITLELDKQSCAELNNYTAKYVKVYQRDNSDREVFTIVVQKVP